MKSETSPSETARDQNKSDLSEGWLRRRVSFTCLTSFGHREMFGRFSGRVATALLLVLAAMPICGQRRPGPTNNLIRLLRKEDVKFAASISWNLSDGQYLGDEPATYAVIHPDSTRAVDTLNFYNGRTGQRIYRYSPDGPLSFVLRADLVAVGDSGPFLVTIWNAGVHSQVLRVFDPRRKRALLDEVYGAYTVDYVIRDRYIAIRADDYPDSQGKLQSHFTRWYPPRGGQREGNGQVRRSQQQ